MNKLKGLKNLLRREILSTLDKNRKRYISLISILIFFLIANFIQINIYSKSIKDISLGEFFFYLFKGAENTNILSEITFPTFWLLINIFIVIIIGDNIRSDFKANGVYILTRTSRKIFFISKLIGILLNIIIYYIIIFSIALILGIFNFKYTTYFNYDSSILKTSQFILLVAILYLTTSIAIISFYCFLNILVNEKYLLVIVSIILILSVYINNHLVIGNNSMIIRQLYWISEDLSSIFKVVSYNTIFTVLNCIGGIALINKKDIL